MHTTPTTNPTAVGQTTTPALSPVERQIMAGLGGKPFTLADYTPELLRSAKETLSLAAWAVGFKTTVGWITDEGSNPKMAKAGIPTVGVTLLAARSAAAIWAEIDTVTRQNLAAALDVTIDDINRAVRLTVCPYATPSCTMACVTNTSFNAELETSKASRLVRTLVTLLRPAEACALTMKSVLDLAKKHGFEDARWRTNVSDDIRWEYLAPGLFGHVKAYAYTKFPAVQRPNTIEGLTIVYSATERSTEEEIRALINAGERVAVVLDVTKKNIPAQWRGMPVADGDVTDDLWSHDPGHIVGLSAKGTRAKRERMRTSGFAHPL
jgi:hypothetical protein